MHEKRSDESVLVHEKETENQQKRLPRIFSKKPVPHKVE